MSQHLSFTTAQDEHAAGHDGDVPEPPLQLITFDVDDHPYAAVRPIDEGFLDIIAAASRQATLPDKVHAVFGFLDACTVPDEIRLALEQQAEGLEDDDELERHPVNNPQQMALLMASGQRIADRLRDRQQPGFDVHKLFEIMQSIVSGWTGRPTTSPRASSTSRRASGRKSTGSSRTKASTSSRSSATPRRGR